MSLKKLYANIFGSSKDGDVEEPDDKHGILMFALERKQGGEYRLVLVCCGVCLSMLSVSGCCQHEEEGRSETEKGEEQKDAEGGRDMSVRGVMKQLADQLHLASHFVRGKTLAGAGDIECHYARDGRMYLLDLARTFPPEDPVSCTHLSRWGQPVIKHLLFVLVHIFPTLPTLFPFLSFRRSFSGCSAMS